LATAGVKRADKGAIGTAVMTPERFREIEQLYHAVCEGSDEERAALLARTDPELRSEVESLLSPRTGGEFLDRPAIQNAPELISDSGFGGLAVGARLGPYCIESKLGQGGMGEVYRAVDTRLDRAVAIKIMRQQFSARFEREARAIAALNHSHICTLYDIGPNFLVMELVEGETLAAWLKSGPLPLNAVLLYASQILIALAEAHGKGVVHRDLKPANIMIAKSGIKVLDFGLAKSGQDDSVTASHRCSPNPDKCGWRAPCGSAPSQWRGRPASAKMRPFITPRRRCSMRISEMQPRQSRALTWRSSLQKAAMWSTPRMRWRSRAILPDLK
jgi:hypothetical protein